MNSTAVYARFVTNFDNNKLNIPSPHRYESDVVRCRKYSMFGPAEKVSACMDHPVMVPR